MLPEHWIEHRREDGELVGWIEIEGEAFHAHDILGRRVSSEPLDWVAAESVLEELGIGFLADRYLLRLPDGSERPVRISEVSSRGIVVIADEFGGASAVGSDADTFELPFPVPDALRPITHSRERPD